MLVVLCRPKPVLPMQVWADTTHGLFGMKPVRQEVYLWVSRFAGFCPHLLAFLADVLFH